MINSVFNTTVEGPQSLPLQDVFAKIAGVSDGYDNKVTQENTYGMDNNMA